jgi:hypothetical protein
MHVWTLRFATPCKRLCTLLTELPCLRVAPQHDRAGVSLKARWWGNRFRLAQCRWGGRHKGHGLVVQRLQWVWVCVGQLTLGSEDSVYTATTSTASPTAAASWSPSPRKCAFTHFCLQNSNFVSALTDPPRLPPSPPKVRVEAQVGQGGYSDIYRVADGSGRHYALKHLRLAGDQEHIAEVQREAKTMARVRGGGGGVAWDGCCRNEGRVPCHASVQDSATVLWDTISCQNPV